MSDQIDELKKKLTAKKKPGANEPKWDLGLSTGAITLNLACSGRPDVGLAPDHYYVWSGSSGSGKTFVGLTILAEASINKAYKDHRLIYDPTEGGALMDFQRFFGKELARRIEPPAGTKDKPKSSRTLEEMYHNIFNALSTGPCVYLVDSMDPLPTEKELKDFLAKNRSYNKKAKGEQIDKKESGSMGMERAKANSHYLRLLFNKLQADSNSIVFVIFQSRQNVGPAAMFNPDTRGGGVAPTFYAGMELHSKVVTNLKTKDKISGKQIEQGVICKVSVKKGRITGKKRTVQIPIYHSGDAPGIDDVGACVDYMTEWKRWPKSGKDFDSTDGKIDAVDFKIHANREKVIQHILVNNLEADLKRIVTATWNEIEEACTVHRKRRYE